MKTANTIQISGLNMKMIEADGFICLAGVVDTPKELDFSIPEQFLWPEPAKEAAKSNTDAYLAYFQKFVDGLKLLQVKKSVERLYTTVGSTPHHLSGDADLYVMSIDCKLACTNQLAMVVEMKPGPIEQKNLAQAMGYVIAAHSLLDITGRPPPVGLLTDFKGQWWLIWVNSSGEIVYAAFEKDVDENRKTLTRETAIYYIRKHFEYYNELLRNEGKTKKRKSGDVGWAFDGFEAGFLKKQRIGDVEDNMLDMLETEEEIALYSMSKRLNHTPLFQIPPPAEKFSYYS